MDVKVEYEQLIEEMVNMLLKQKDILHACDIFKSLSTDVIHRVIDKAFTKVYIINSNPDETRQEITDKYNFRCEWEGTPGSCGVITVYVPKDKCTKALLDKFRQYDPQLGARWSNDACKTYPTID